MEVIEKEYQRTRDDLKLFFLTVRMLKEDKLDVGDCSDMLRTRIACR